MNRPRMVRNARSALRWFSTQAFIALAALPVVWAQLPPDVKNMLPEGWEPYLLTAIAVSGVVGRLVDQGGDE